uniref:tRNA-dihydrouridine synthase (DusB) n=1 Tax=uncultured marine group II/III euryarchaeote KM3_83_G03 TaxID=1456522 RepID=A0A075HVT4_9EURY|nr:tRNA-dihydrouridine synthase (dusB) [uncultured marine group II/III euryarchaeote KM3_83_G03]
METYLKKLSIINEMFPKLKGKAVLSPMAGVTDVAFRALAKKYGAALTYTEFVSSAALVRNSTNTLKMLKTDPSETPVAVQLFGNNSNEIVQSAKMLQDKFDIIDVNCGCPAWKVIKTGAGSALLNNPRQIHSFISKLVESVDIPVTLKIRAGIDGNTINAVEVAKIAEEGGASAIGIHGRTQKQGYSGEADWNIIKQVKDTVKIPVIGNGDVFTPETFKEKINMSGVDYIMIARGAMGNPYVFQQVNDFLATGKYSEKNKIELFKEYLKLAEKYDIRFPVIKNHAVQFTKGLKGSSHLRGDLNKCNTSEQILDLLYHMSV